MSTRKLMDIPSCMASYRPAVVGTDSGELVTQGRFEAGDLLGWEVYSPDNAIGIATRSSGMLAPQSGAFYCFMGDASATGGIRQTLATEAGQTYTISFFVSHGSYGGGNDNRLDVLWQGNPLLSLTGVDDFSNRLFSFEIRATSTATEIIFCAQDATGGFGIDDVSVTPTRTEYPTKKGRCRSRRCGMPKAPRYLSERKRRRVCAEKSAE